MKAKSDNFMKDCDRVPLMFGYANEKINRISMDTMKRMSGYDKQEVTTNGIYTRQKKFVPISHIIMYGEDMNIEGERRDDNLISIKYRSVTLKDWNRKFDTSAVAYIFDDRIRRFPHRVDIAQECFHMVLDAYKYTDDYVPESLKKCFDGYR